MYGKKDKKVPTDPAGGRYPLCDEFELAAFSDAYKSMTCRDITVTDLMKAYLDGLEGDTLLEELDGLERFIKEKRKENGMGKRID